jgi:hypothetical protein
MATGPTFALLAALACGLAGCTAVRDEGIRDRAVLSEGVPTWHVGDSWNYTIQDGEGKLLGWARYDVEGVEPVPNLTARAYRVNFLQFSYGDVDHDGVPNQTYNRTVWFDAANLNMVVNACGKPYIIGDCKHRARDLDFPLRQGKTWTSTSGGDVIIDFEHRATTDGERWTIERRAPTSTGWVEPHQVDTYDPAQRFYVERRFSHGTYAGVDHPPEVWRLAEHG